MKRAPASQSLSTPQPPLPPSCSTPTPTPRPRSSYPHQVKVPPPQFTSDELPTYGVGSKNWPTAKVYKSQINFKPTPTTAINQCKKPKEKSTYKRNLSHEKRSSMGLEGKSHCWVSAVLTTNYFLISDMKLYSIYESENSIFILLASPCPGWLSFILPSSIIWFLNLIIAGKSLTHLNEQFNYRRWLLAIWTVFVSFFAINGLACIFCWTWISWRCCIPLLHGLPSNRSSTWHVSPSNRSLIET